MNYDLAAMVSAKRRHRRSIEIRPIIPTDALASNLYQKAYKPIIVAMQQGADRIAAAYRGAREQSGFKDAAADDPQGQVESFGEEMQRLILSIFPELQDWALQTEKWHRGKWRSAVLSATDVDLTTILLASGTPISVQQSIDWNVSLIKSVSDEARSRIGNLVFAAVRAQTPVAALARDIRDAVAMSKARALRIASDQTKKLAASLDQERQTEAGIDEYVWRHSYKAHPRAFHVARNGKRFQWNDPPEDGPPGTLPYCGCRAQAVVEF